MSRQVEHKTAGHKWQLVVHALSEDGGLSRVWFCCFIGGLTSAEA